MKVENYFQVNFLLTFKFLTNMKNKVDKVLNYLLIISLTAFLTASLCLYRFSRLIEPTKIEYYENGR